MFLALSLGLLVFGSACSPEAERDPDPYGEESTPETRVRVQVLNAGGVPGVAQMATDRLRDHGFDVVYLGNAPSFGPDSSVVLARLGDTLAARRVARTLGILRVENEADSSLLVDVTVRLGSEWTLPAASG